MDDHGKDEASDSLIAFNKDVDYEVDETLESAFVLCRLAVLSITIGAVAHTDDRE